MAIVKEIVVREGWEDIHAQATNKLANFDAELDNKVAEYRAKLVAEMDNERTRWEKIVELSTEEIEKEVPDEEPTENVVEGTEPQVTEQY